MPEIGERRVRTATFVVAASDSMVQDKAMADYVCDGVNDHVEIQAALDALPATGGEVKLLDGTYRIEVSLVLDSYQTLRGCGRSTILTTTTAGWFDIITATGGSGTEKVGILIADLCIDCDAGGVATNSGIFLTYVDYSVVSHCWLLDSGSAGIWIAHCDFNVIDENIGQGNYNEAIYLERSNNNVIQDNVCQGNDDDGIYVDNHSLNNIISGNTCQGNGKRGIYVSLLSNNNLVSSNCCQGNNRAGIQIETSNDNLIADNICTENSQGSTNTYDDIYLLDDANHNNIQGNTCRAGSLANKPAYGINISAATCDGNLVTNNDLYNDGFGTAPFNDAGTGTVKKGNRGCIASGEEMIAEGALVPGNANAFAFAWQNPYPTAVLVTRVIIDVTTPGGTALSVLDVGIAADATTHSDNLVDGMDLNTAGLYDNLDNPGVNGKSKQKLAANGGANDWVTGQILVANAAALAGKYYIYYTGL